MITRFFFAIFALILAVGKVIVPLFIGIILACFLCNIYNGETYSWLSGIWHGMFFLPNFVRHLYDPDTLYKASSCTTMYNIYWWFFAITEIISAIPVAIFVIGAAIAGFTIPKEELE